MVSGGHSATRGDLITPESLLKEISVAQGVHETVSESRNHVRRILNRDDDRLLLVIGPCSIHDPEAAKVLAEFIKGAHKRFESELYIVMRTYFAKPRTTVGWKGMVHDPHLDGSCDVNEGLRRTRQMLLDIVSIGLPVACEFLDVYSPLFIQDLVSWGAIGARTSESQVHREFASGLDIPVGFKNGTHGHLATAIDAVRSASVPHSYFGSALNGQASIISTLGNQDCHIVLRGGHHGPNHDEASVKKAASMIQKADLPCQSMMVDCAHGNCQRDYRRQRDVALDVARQVAAGQCSISGVMMETNLVAGKQTISPQLVFGQSITDECLGWDAMESILGTLAHAVRSRRRLSPPLHL